jgi:hypothetical protein
MLASGRELGVCLETVGTLEAEHDLGPLQPIQRGADRLAAGLLAPQVAPVKEVAR